LHKTEYNAVIVDLRTVAEVENAYEQMEKRVMKGYKKKGEKFSVVVQEMVTGGVETVIGMNIDPAFGPLIMFGLGGIYVEVLKDVSFRIVPLTKRDAMEMIKEIKGYPLLQGYRGQEPADISNLEEWLLKVSNFVEQNPEVKELDLNPIFAYSDGAVAVDARVILEGIDKSVTTSSLATTMVLSSVPIASIASDKVV